MSKRRRDQKKADYRPELETKGAPSVPKCKAKGPLEPMTEAQRHYISSIRHNRITWGIGPAGVGKTYVAARVASDMLRNKEISKIILTRPAIEAGASIGFLPGELEDKMAPYIASYGRGFGDGLGGGSFAYYMQYKIIEVVPLNFMQGRSFDEPTLVLLDEAENATPAEMKMFLTRMGAGATMIIDGDPKQTMIRGQSGLIDGVQKTRYIHGVGVVEFDRDDIVRDPMIKEILNAYECEPENDDGDAALGLPSFITETSE